MYRIIPQIVLFFLISLVCNAQNKWRPYLNGGYVTSFEKGTDNQRADAGGSVRIGVLHKGMFGKGRMGFYAGYLWFNVYYEDYIDYDDKGSALIAGVDFLFLDQENLQWYIKLGIAREKLISTYSYRTETEFSIKPDLGLLINYKHFNTYLGWMPSEPGHINLGIGFTF